MSSAKLNVNSEWLVWARKTANYKTEDIAKKIKKNPETIHEWEKTGKITFEDLEKLAEEYKRSTTLFFNEDKPIYPKKIPDFRTIGSKKKDITPKIEFEIRKAKFRRQTLLNLEEESEDYVIPNFPHEKFQTDNIDKISDILRNLIGINRFKTKSKKISILKQWIREIEKLGVLVFEFYGISPEELRGYALYYDKLPIIGINHKESLNPQKFTLFHEMAHIILKKEGISDLNNYYFANDKEFLCNKIAAETLVPTKMFKEYIKDSDLSTFKPQHIQRLSKVFNVSEQVIVRRALTLNLITKNQFASRKKEFNSYINSTKKKSKKETKAEKSDKNEIKNHKKGLHNKAVISLRKNGEYFTKSLFEAYENNVITDIDLALDLGVSIEVMNEIRRLLMEEFS